MRNDTKSVIQIVLAVIVAIVALFGIITATKVFVTPTPVMEEEAQIVDTALDIERSLGVVRRVTEPSTGAITGYDVRGEVMAVDTDENTITLSISEGGDETLLVSLGNNAEVLGFLDKRSESSEREGLIEKNTYTSDVADSILGKIVTNQTLLVHVPVWIQTPEPSRCDAECMERVESLRTRGEEYIPELEGIIQNTVPETETIFTISILEIED